MSSERGLKWLVGRRWFWALAITLLFLQPLVRTLFRERPKLPPVGAQLSSFELVRETGEPVGTRDLGGKVWVASFVPASDFGEVGAALSRVQRRLRHMGDSYRLVTIVVDPIDPKALAEKAKALHPN